MDKKILYTGKVVNNQDIYVTGMVRIIPDQAEDVQALLSDYFKKSGLTEKQFYSPDKRDINQQLYYTNNDPFVFQQFGTSSLSFQPEVNDLCLLIYSNKEDNTGRKNQYYIPAPKHSIQNIASETASKTKGNLAEGINFSSRKPLKNRNNEYNNKKCFGCFAEPQDNAIYGKGTTNIILKKNDILFRSGSCLNMENKEVPEINEKMGFIQLSHFDGNKVKIKDNEIVNNVPETSPISKIVEYDITSGLEDGVDSYDGSVKIFNVPPLKEMAQNLFGFLTPIPSQVKTPIKEFTFTGLPASGASECVSNILQGLNDGLIELNDENKTTYTPTEPIFPFFYRPSINLRDILSSLANPIDNPSDFLKKANTISIYSDIKLSGSLNISGFGLVRGKNKFGQGTKKVKEKNPAHKYDNKPTSATLFASNYVYLLSHDTKLQSQKEGIQLKKKDFYGISSDTIVDEIYPKTQSMVRGESLKELLEMIVSFLVNHSHPFSQRPPYNEAENITKSDITSELAQFNSKVLNPNIRIN